MAIYHLSVKPVQRSKGRSATGAAAYRSGEYLVDERTGDIHDYTRKRGVEYSEIITPNEESIDREKLWNLAEQAEKRKDSTLAREYEIALPEELDEKQRLELAKDFAKYLAERHWCVVDLAIHAPGRGGDHRNHHAHLLCTTRKFESGGSLGAKCDIELSDRDRVKKSLPGRKTELEATREYWAFLGNQALEKAGHTARMSHKSFEEQGINQTPGIHLGPTATAMERRGLVSDRGQLYRLHRELAEKHQAVRAELAAAELIESGLSGMKDKAQQYKKDIQARVKASELARQQEELLAEVERAAIEAGNRVRLEQEKKAELQKETQKAENDRCQQRRDPGRGR